MAGRSNLVLGMEQPPDMSRVSRQHVGLDRDGRDGGVSPMQGLGTTLVSLAGRLPTHGGHEHEARTYQVPQVGECAPLLAEVQADT